MDRIAGGHYRRYCLLYGLGCGALCRTYHWRYGAALFFMLPRIWAKRTNVFFCGFNIAWSIRNFILFSRCYAGDCPEKTASLYILLAASAIMLLMSFVPDISIQQEAEAAADTNKTTSL